MWAVGAGCAWLILERASAVRPLRTGLHHTTASLVTESDILQKVLGTMRPDHLETCMPFTPFHLGAGVAAKALAPRLISLQVFALTQVAMDIEPGVRMAMGAGDLHGWTHTLAGAAPMALVSVIAWKILEGRRIWRWTFEPVSTTMLWTTACVGSWSHVLMDALIHQDMATTRALLGLGDMTLFSHEFIEASCLIAAAAGIALLALRQGARGCAEFVRGIVKNLSQPPGCFGRSRH